MEMYYTILKNDEEIYTKNGRSKFFSKKWFNVKMYKAKIETNSLKNKLNLLKDLKDD